MTRQPVVCDALERWTPGTATTHRWASAEPSLAGLDFDATLRLLHDRNTPHDRKDDILTALVRLAASDPDAATAVVVCLLPGLKAIARRLHGRCSSGELWGELLTQLLEHVHRYDLERRPRRIAANLLLLLWSCTTCS